MVFQWRIIHGGSSPCCCPSKLQSLKVKQQSPINNFISKLKTTIEECDLAGGTLSEQRLQQIFDGFSADIHEQLLNIGQGAGDTEADESQCIKTGQGYHWHYFDGCFHHVPKD